MPSIPEVEEFEESMEDLADQITSDYDKLREIIQYRDYIICVWVEKMTIKDRQTMLESILGIKVLKNRLANNAIQIIIYIPINIYYFN